MRYDPVRPSRAGDAFHYRWAARRCLRMIDPKSGLECITIEGSKSPSAAGELSIDLAEYAKTPDGRSSVTYYQLKHSTRRLQLRISLSELKPTLKQFAARFRRESKVKRSKAPRIVEFRIVTNRKISPGVLVGVGSIAAGKTASSEIARELAKLTKFNPKSLRKFCATLGFTDDEGGFVVQKQQLRRELARYFVGPVDNDDVGKIINLVSERALPQPGNPKRGNEIVREDLLAEFGVTDPLALFPAPPDFEPLGKRIRREQHAALLAEILRPGPPLLIHAEGGVGKTVVARMLASAVPPGSVAIIYDCFGAGLYRSPIKPRHHVRHALVQIANELASRGLCHFLIPRKGFHDEDFCRAFVERLKESIANLPQKSALLLFVDAADNAELAAEEANEACFAAQLLRMPLPPRCRLTMLCRTERRHRLKPLPTVRQVQLVPFSLAETTLHLVATYPRVSQHEIAEFHAHSGGNPRVQANAIAERRPNVTELLQALGPGLTTLNEQIAAQLQTAINRVKEPHPPSFASQIDALCYGLANLPPLIPLEVLATVAAVDVAAVKSFIVDLGGPLWHSADDVHFRDEPTETWFKEHFKGTPEHLAAYIKLLEPLAETFTYVAKALPRLYLLAGEYDKLIDLALSDRLLPADNPIEARDVLVFRLQFAFKATLKRQHYADASKLAFRAGEEVAGDTRQIELLGKNVDLVSEFQERERVKELAIQRVLGGGWDGCENIYSAALLASIPDFAGEAAAYFRSARHWIGIYFKRREKLPEIEARNDDRLTESHILEMVWAEYHLYGTRELIGRLNRWQPADLVFRVMKNFFSRLIDHGRYAEIEKVAREGADNIYLMLAAADELMAVAMFPPAWALRVALRKLARAKTRPEKPSGYEIERQFFPAMMSLLEACAARKLPGRTVLRALRHYIPAKADGMTNNDHSEGGRGLLLRGLALRAAVERKAAIDLKAVLPEPKEGETPAVRNDDHENLLKMLGALLPWYSIRANLLLHPALVSSDDLKNAFETSRGALGTRYRTVDRIPFEASLAYFQTLALHRRATADDLDLFRKEIVDRSRERFWLTDRIDATRTAYRQRHLAGLRQSLEQSCSQDLQRKGTDRPEERGDLYIRLSRAVLIERKNDANAYFSAAVETASKFGDEMVERWEAVVAVARRSSVAAPVSEQIVYEFVRCAEVIGETVAREKYWNRDDVFQVAGLLHPAAALAALARWRDRDVFDASNLTVVLATSLVSNGRLSPRAAWCLTGFGDCNASVAFAALCILRESDPGVRQQMFTRTVRDLALAGASREEWQKLREAAIAAGVSSSNLTGLIARSPSRPSESPMPKVSASTRRRIQREDRKTAARAKSFARRGNFLDPAQFHRAVSGFRSSQTPRNPGLFWKEVIRRVPANKELQFLPVLVAEPDIDYLDMVNALVEIQKRWRSQPAIARAWPQFLHDLGRRHAPALANVYRLQFWRRNAALSDDDLLALRAGMVDGLADSQEIMDAGSLFGFVTGVANRLTPVEATALLEFALARFRLHIAPDAGDGDWAQWLSAPLDSVKAYTGFLWASLGSPYASARWEATHAVRRLAELRCDAEIGALVEWLQQGVPNAYSSNRYSFYLWHAKQYLLLALARAAVDSADGLKRHATALVGFATAGTPHFLIQKYAAEICLAIERDAPGSIDSAQLSDLGKIGVSPFPPVEEGNERSSRSSPWHVDGSVDRSVEFGFGMDLGDRWLRPLGDAFGIPQKEVEELVGESAVRDFGGVASRTYQADPRRMQFNNRDRMGTYYKDSYGRIDDFRFYVSYHGMMSVAARLLRRMPTIRRTHGDWTEDRWPDWSKRHLLTRADGRWLSDRRDPSPSRRAACIDGPAVNPLIWTIPPTEFLDALHGQAALKGSLVVDGFWSDCNGERIENLRVCSALVEKETAGALVQAMRWNERLDCYLPSFDEGQDESGTPPFRAHGWIRRPESPDSQIDSFDPYAKSILYPPLEIAPPFATALQVSPDSEIREWRADSDSTVKAICEIWSERPEPSFREERPYRHGRRMSVSIGSLRKLCQESKKELIITVTIDRLVNNTYGRKNQELGYVPASHQVFTFSANGQLRDAKKSYQIG
jgi:hypothetical protein